MGRKKKGQHEGLQIINDTNKNHFSAKSVVIMILAPRLSVRSLRPSLFQHKIPCGIASFGTGPIAPFGDALDPMDAQELGLQDFAFYEPATLVKAGGSIESVADMDTPVIVELRLADPFTNLAIEEHIYDAMPSTAYRLMTYYNEPCVVVGKNQNPWLEVNMPALTRLGIPLVRRHSGGGTVFHDRGNLNYSFMSSQAEFDRQKFAKLVAQQTNALGKSDVTLDTNARGDIVTACDAGYKVGGSAFRVLRGKAYHHGTLLLDLKLQIMSQLLKPSKVGTVISKAAVKSVPAAGVRNVDVSTRDVVSAIQDGFIREYGRDHEVTHLTIDETTELPAKVHEKTAELREYKWRFGKTPPFTHEFAHENQFSVVFHVGKGAIVREVTLARHPECDSSTFTHALQLLQILQDYITGNLLEYTGSSVAGFVTDDSLSDWIGMAIDGTT